MQPRGSFVVLTALIGIVAIRFMPAIGEESQPVSHVYREADGKKLSAHVFMPSGEASRRRTSAILLFHGGGWVAGRAEWTFDDARRFAALGMAAVAIEYRLSEGTNTPIEALEDARAAFRWVRRQAAAFNIDPGRVAGYGVSAGGYLVAAAALVDFPGEAAVEKDAGPDLLLLWSPALDVAADRWFVQLLRGRAAPADYSPMEHAGAATPPTSIVIGDRDTVTPLPRAKLFRDRVVLAGGICELNVYPGVGHLLTRNLAHQESDFDPDPVFRADGKARQERFLRERGYLPANEVSSASGPAGSEATFRRAGPSIR